MHHNLQNKPNEKGLSHQNCILMSNPYQRKQRLEFKKNMSYNLTLQLNMYSMSTKTSGRISIHYTCLIYK